jgi:hypothetical protein
LIGPLKGGWGDRETGTSEHADAARKRLSIGGPDSARDPVSPDWLQMEVDPFHAGSRPGFDGNGLLQLGCARIERVGKPRAYGRKTVLWRPWRSEGSRNWKAIVTVCPHVVPASRRHWFDLIVAILAQSGPGHVPDFASVPLFHHGYMATPKRVSEIVHNAATHRSARRERKPYAGSGLSAARFELFAGRPMAEFVRIVAVCGRCAVPPWRSVRDPESACRTGDQRDRTGIVLSGYPNGMHGDLCSRNRLARDAVHHGSVDRYAGRLCLWGEHLADEGAAAQE